MQGRPTPSINRFSQAEAQGILINPMERIAIVEQLQILRSMVVDLNVQMDEARMAGNQRRLLSLEVRHTVLYLTMFLRVKLLQLHQVLSSEDLASDSGSYAEEGDDDEAGSSYSDYESSGEPSSHSYDSLSMLSRRSNLSTSGMFGSSSQDSSLRFSDEFTTISLHSSSDSTPPAPPSTPCFGRGGG